MYPVSKKKAVIQIVFYVAAFAVCILWIAARINISQRMKWDAMKTDNYLTGAIDALDSYIGGDDGSWDLAAERLHSYYTAVDFVTGSKVNRPRPDSDTAEKIRLLSTKMLGAPETLKPGAEKLREALGLLRDDSESAEAKTLIEELLNGNLAAGE